MKFIKNWKFAFLLSLICLYSIFALYAFKEESTLPSAGFSRHIELARIETSSFQDSRNDSTISSLSLDEGDLALLYFDKSLKYLRLSEGARVVEDLSFNIELNDLSKIKLKSVSSNEIIFYSLEEANLYINHLDKSSNDLKKALIHDNVKSMEASDKFLTLVLKDGYQILKSNLDSFDIIYESKADIRNLSNLVEYKDNLYFAYLANDDKGVQKLWTYNYMDESKTSSLQGRWTIASSGNYSTSSLSIALEDGLMTILHEGMDYKTGISTLTAYVQENLELKNTDFSKNQLKGLKQASNSRLISNTNNELKLIARVPNEKSDSQIAHDIYIFTYDDFNLSLSKRLTKSGGNSSNPSFILNGNSSYLLWTDSIGMEKRILIAGDNKEIIDYSKVLNKDDLFKVLMDVLLILSPTFFAFILPVLSIAGPIIFVLVIISFVNLTYLESKGKKLLSFILLAHFILKYRFIYDIVFSSMANIQVLLPSYISNIYLFSGFILLLTLLSLFISYLKNPSFLDGKDIWMTYISFMLVDLLIMWIAVMPYLYMFLE